MSRTAEAHHQGGRGSEYARHGLGHMYREIGLSGRHHDRTLVDTERITILVQNLEVHTARRPVSFLAKKARFVTTSKVRSCHKAVLELADAEVVLCLFQDIV